MSRRVAAAALVAATVAGCGTGAKLRREADALRNELVLARTERGALRCAPEALARADANLAFFRDQVDAGDALEATYFRDRVVEEMAAVEAGIGSCDRDGDGVSDADDRCPETPGPAEFNGCPDGDGDGIPDVDDRCPAEPEDMDGYEDDDGCPEEQDTDGDGLIDPEDRCPEEPGPIEEQGCPVRDADGDGIVDGLDLCPDDPETKNGYRDDDGCPDKKLKLVKVDLDKGKIEIKQKVFFATGKSTIRRRSFPLLREVAQVLRDNPEMRIVVEGHTDSRGSNSLNLRLSQARADSVRAFLIENGIAGDRLTAIGFGEEQPIASNRSAAGRERNRRVEFTIVKRTEN